MYLFVHYIFVYFLGKSTTRRSGLATTTTRRPKRRKKQPAINFDPPKNMEKFTAQQIIRQQILNQQRASGQDMDTQASDQFWSTLQSRGEENMARIQNQQNEKFNHMLFETAADINNFPNSDHPKTEVKIAELNHQNLPKIQFENIIPQTTLKPHRSDNSLYVSPATPQVQNQFLLQEKLRQKQIEEMNKHAESSTSIQVFNPGSSGLQMVCVILFYILSNNKHIYISNTFL